MDEGCLRKTLDASLPTDHRGEHDTSVTHRSLDHCNVLIPISRPHSNHALRLNTRLSNPRKTAGNIPSQPEPGITARQETSKESLRASIEDLESQAAQIESRVAEIKAKLKNEPSETVKRHIRLLHEYNDVKDVGQGLIGLIADARGMRQVDVQKEFGVGGQD
ncbi:SWI5/SAE3 family protein [Aspergillus lucknowensis]|uniref:Swi5-domain-containing protein n=1 Tax=Aspergillus lucknowensis TaxID=176173 RepID=A0ABR4LQN6_9EURO